MREFSWFDVVFGVILGAILLFAGTMVATAVLMAFPDRTLLAGKHDFIYLSPVILLAGMAFLAWRYPGPGRIVERPLLMILAVIVWPAIAAVMDFLGTASSVVFIAFEGLFLTTLLGFAIFFAVYTEARESPAQETSWPIDRPASFGWMGSKGVPINKVMMYAGLERGGTEEERPDTFVRMKMKE